MTSKTPNSYLNENVKDNILQLFLYKTAFPFALMFRSLKFTPNNVTLLSFLICLVSNLFLLNGHSELFLVFWYLSHFLDYVDGTLARITDNKTKILLRVDHLSDLIKIQTTIICFCIHYNSLFVWLIFSTFNIIFWFSELLSQQHLYILKSHIDKPVKRVKPMLSNKILRNIYVVFFTFNGHSLFLLGIGLINPSLFMGLLIYYGVLLLKRLYLPIFYLTTNLRE